MRKFCTSVAVLALLAGVAGISTPSRAETGQVAVIFTKGGFIVGVGGGEGVLILRGQRYPFTVSGMSVRPYALVWPHGWSRHRDQDSVGFAPSEDSEGGLQTRFPRIFTA